MQRRDFIGLIGATALSIPRPGYTQTQTDMPLVGFLLVQKLETSVAKDRITVLRKGLQEEGFIERTNYSLAVRSAEGDVDRYPQFARELGALNARVIVVSGSLYGLVDSVLCTAGSYRGQKTPSNIARQCEKAHPKADRLLQGACPKSGAPRHHSARQRGAGDAGERCPAKGVGPVGL